MKGYQIINRLLVEAGVSTVFQYMAEDTMELMSDMEENWSNDLTVIHSRHEQGAMAMADGYARSGDGIGVCIVGRGPGIAQTGTALVNARKGKSRLLVIVPTFSYSVSHDPKNFEQDRYLKSTVENVVTIQDHDLLVPEFSEALRRVYQGESPLAVQIPKNILNDNIDNPPSSSNLTFTNSPYDSGRFRSLDPDYGHRLEPDPARIKTAVDLYLESDAFQPPVIIAGDGATHAKTEIEKLAERLNAILLTSMKGIDLFHDHPFAIGFSGNWGEPLSNEFLFEANYIIAVGCSLNYHTVDNGELIDEDTTIVHIDSNPRNLGRYTPVDLGIVGDSKLTISSLNTELEEMGINRGTELWTDKLRNRIADYSALDGKEYPGKPGVMDPRDLMRKLDEVLPKQRLVAADGGCFRRWLLHELLTPPKDSLVSCDFGAIGLGLPLGIGASQYLVDEGKDECDNRTAVTICGDGGVLMAIQELETAVRHDIPVVVIVGNDSSLGSEYHHLDVRGYNPNLARLSTPSIADVAEAFGAEGYVVTTLDDLEELEDKLVQPDGPILIECIIDHVVRHHSY